MPMSPAAQIAPDDHLLAVAEWRLSSDDKRKRTLDQLSLERAMLVTSFGGGSPRGRRSVCRRSLAERREFPPPDHNDDVSLHTDQFGREMSASRRSAEQADEVAPPHSITSSALASNNGGITTPIALAVFRLTMVLNFVACSIGMSPGLAPLRISSTKTAERRYIAEKSTP
jgi:hypothetical protein